MKILISVTAMVPETGQMWGKFIAVLNAEAKTPADDDLAIKTANATFTHFSDVFTEVKVVQHLF